MSYRTSHSSTHYQKSIENFEFLVLDFILFFSLYLHNLGTFLLTEGYLILFSSSWVNFTMMVRAVTYFEGHQFSMLVVEVFPIFLLNIPLCDILVSSLPKNYYSLRLLHFQSAMYLLYHTNFSDVTCD